MNFFRQRDEALASSFWLYWVFGLGILGFVFAINVATYLILNLGKSRVDLMHPIFLWVTVVTVGIIALGALFKSLSLNDGGASIALEIGATLVDSSSTDPEELRLLNVVEEMAIAAGVPVPAIFVLKSEGGINAFTAGTHFGNAAIVVTTGALKLLSRDELQGVIAHEFSHIFHEDVRINMRLLILISGIFAISAIGRGLFQSAGRSTGRSSKNAAQVMLLGGILFLIGYAGVLMGRLIQSAISRQREYLADASAVQYTRNSKGIEGALKKIGGINGQSYVDAENTEEIAHFFFADSRKAGFFSAFATHPPILKRIRLLDPAFNGKFPQLASVKIENVQKPAEDVKEAAAGARKIAANLSTSGDLLAQIPANIREIAKDPYSARALLFALVFHEKGYAEHEQNLYLEQHFEPHFVSLVTKIFETIRPFSGEIRLILLNLTLPMLQKLSASQLKDFIFTIEPFMRADKKLDLFEYLIVKVILLYCRPRKNISNPITKISEVDEDLQKLFSYLAYTDAASTTTAAPAYKKAEDFLGVPLKPILPNEVLQLKELDSAINRLSNLALALRTQVLNASVEIVTANGVCQAGEREFLRLISLAFNCPMPLLRS
jgi:Zn-dependent protease with chaperone function